MKQILIILTAGILFLLPGQKLVAQESTQLESTQLESTQLESTQLESTQLESIRLESIRLESIRLESIRLESIRLEKLWEVNQGLATPESAVYDSLRSCLYVSNFNDKGGFRQKTDTLRDEYITKLNLDGKILELKWLDGLLGPLGLVIRDDVLYIVERGAVVKADISSQEIIDRIPVPETVFLNDIALDAQGNIYLSDSRKDGCIHRVSKGQAGVWLRDSLLQNCNGLYMDGSQLLIGNRGDGRLLSVNTNSKKVRILTPELPSVPAVNLDGIRKAGDNYIVSWRYEIFLISPEGESTLLLSTAESEDWNADMEYIPQLNMLIVPTLLSNKLVAYRLRK